MKNFKERKWAQKKKKTKTKNTKVLECVLWRDSFIRRFLHRQVEDSSVSSKLRFLDILDPQLEIPGRFFLPSISKLRLLDDSLISKWRFLGKQEEIP
jgi:hypothetical protein